MKDRIIALAGGLISLLLVIALFAPQSEPNNNVISKPTTIDTGKAGLKALKLWLDDSGIDTHSLRYRYDWLREQKKLNATGNLLIISNPGTTEVNYAEAEALRQWLAKGNHAMMMIAAADHPDWVGDEFNISRALLDSMDLQLSLDTTDNESGQTQENADRKLTERIEEIESQVERLKRSSTSLSPLESGHPLTQGMDSVTTYHLPALSERDWKLESAGSKRLIDKLLTSDTGTTALWSVREGNGGLFVSSYPELFANRVLANEGNTILIENLINFTLAQNGQVIFDDMHFGLTDLYDPDTFFADNRLHNTLYFLLAFWLVYLIGHTNRLAPPRDSKPAISTAEFIEAAAGFYYRNLHSTQIAEALTRQFNNDIRAHRRLPENGEPLWDSLKREYPDLYNDLQDTRAKSTKPATRNHDLISLSYQLNTLRKRLQ